MGKDLVKLLQPFKCKILVNDILDFKDFYQENSITPVGLEELMQKSDIVTLHLPLNNSTDKYHKQRSIANVKKGRCNN